MRSEPRTVIRKRTPADDAFIARLGGEAFSEYDPKASETVLRMAGRAPTLVVELDGRPVGFATVEIERSRTAHLSAIAVAEDVRGTGIGRALLLGAERLARSLGGTRMELNTADSNVAALQLFLARGFRRQRARNTESPSGNSRASYSRGQRTLTLYKEL